MYVVCLLIVFRNCISVGMINFLVSLSVCLQINVCASKKCTLRYGLLPACTIRLWLLIKYSIIWIYGTQKNRWYELDLGHLTENVTGSSTTGLSRKIGITKTADRTDFYPQIVGRGISQGSKMTMYSYIHKNTGSLLLYSKS